MIICTKSKGRVILVRCSCRNACRDAAFMVVLKPEPRTMINFSGNIVLVTFRSWSKVGQTCNWRAGRSGTRPRGAAGHHLREPRWSRLAGLRGYGRLGPAR